ncbi:MAG: type transport system permease protein [Rubrobacteraceae bacterium]|nr:type transport system permease protein [Rubrobacteraceae bacterium]
MRGSVWAVLSAIVLSLMSYLLLTDKELSLLDQSEMLYIVASLAVGLGLLVSGILAGDSVAGERERTMLESLLLPRSGARRDRRLPSPRRDQERLMGSEAYKGWGIRGLRRSHRQRARPSQPSAQRFPSL